MVNVFSHNETKILLISLFGAKFEVLTYDSNFTVDKLYKIWQFPRSGSQSD